MIRPGFDQIQVSSSNIYITCLLCALQCNVWGGNQLSCHPWADRRLLITNEFPNPPAPRFIPMVCRQLLITCSRSHLCCWEWEWSSCWREFRAASRSENDPLVVHLLTTHAAAAEMEADAPYPYSRYSCCSKCLGFNLKLFFLQSCATHCKHCKDTFLSCAL